MSRPLFAATRSRTRMLGQWIIELVRYGAPRETGDPRNGTVFLIDGVGGYLLTPTLARRALREAQLPLATVLFDWHRGVRGEMLADLTCHRANRRAALRLARIIRARRRAFPDAPLHILSYSGGTGIAVFAAEKLGKRTRLTTLNLVASALSPDYPLAGALKHVDTCYALTSRRDFAMLGLGTLLFGTMDRRFGASAGLRGFRNLPVGEAASASGRFVELPWRPELCRFGHAGHHTGAASVAFVRECIVPLLVGNASASPAIARSGGDPPVGPPTP